MASTKQHWAVLWFYIPTLCGIMVSRYQHCEVSWSLHTNTVLYLIILVCISEFTHMRSLIRAFPGCCRRCHSCIGICEFCWCICIWSHTISCEASNHLSPVGRRVNQFILSLDSRLHGECWVSFRLLTCLILLPLLSLCLPAITGQQTTLRKCIKWIGCEIVMFALTVEENATPVLPKQDDSQSHCQENQDADHSPS